MRDMKEKECVRRALLSCAAWPVPLDFFGGGHGVPVERGCLFLSILPPCVFLVVLRECQGVDLTLARVWKVLLDWFNVASQTGGPVLVRVPCCYGATSLASLS